jgi:hypothetical protein
MEILRPAFATRVRAGARCHECHKNYVPYGVAVAVAGTGPICVACVPEDWWPLVGIAEGLAQISAAVAELPADQRSGIAQVAGSLLAKLVSGHADTDSPERTR